MATKPPARVRGALIGKIHTLAKRLGYDDGTYRTVLMTQTGKTSCKDMSDGQLSRLADALDCLVKGKPLPDASAAPCASDKVPAGQQLPTAKQWETLAGLANRAGWAGMDDFRLLAFARHTVKVADLSDLSRAAMSKVITGLTRKLGQLAAKTTEERSPA